MSITDHIPGLVLVLFISVFSSYIATLHPSFDALVLSIIIAIFFANVIGVRDSFQKGVDTGIKLFLPLGIALYGSQLLIGKLNVTYFLIVLLVFGALVILTLYVAKAFNIDRRIAILLASGISVCGASAIAVISPLINARKEETSISVISVMMLGLIGMIFYPLLYNLLSLTMNNFAFFCGTTLPMLGQVKVAAGSVSEESLSFALNLKLLRISFLVFLVPLAISLSGKSVKKISVPWFIIVFFVLAVLVNFTGLLHPFMKYFRFSSSFFLCAALASIGYSVDFDAIIEQGITPFVIVFLSWSVMLLLMYITVSLL